MIVDLTLHAALTLAADLAPRDRYEVTGIYPDLASWAYSRVSLPGSAWSLNENGVQAAGGVMNNGPDVGCIWIAGREGWTRYVKQALWIWKLILGLKDHPYRRLECKCYEDNGVARAFVERLGFVPERPLPRFTLRGDNLIQYARAP